MVVVLYRAGDFFGTNNEWWRTIYSCKCENYVFDVSILVLYIDQLVSALEDYCECNWTLYQIVIICVVERTIYLQHCLESENRRRSGLPLAMIS